jgi:cell division protein FtsW (lipid II flippase)
VRLADGGGAGDRRPARPLVSSALLIAIVALLAMQPDFGQAALVLFGWGVIYFVAGAPMLILGVIGLVAAARWPTTIPSISPAGSTAS